VSGQIFCFEEEDGPELIEAGPTDEEDDAQDVAHFIHGIRNSEDARSDDYLHDRGSG
jgi:hypothetical protein